MANGTIFLNGIKYSGGSSSEGGASTWSEVSGKPFSTIGSGLTVENDVLKATGGGTGGTTNYNDLSNKPQINNVELNGNKTLEDIGALSLDGGTMNEKAVINMSGEYTDEWGSYTKKLKISDNAMIFSFDNGSINTKVDGNGIEINSGNLELINSDFSINSGSVYIRPNIKFVSDIVSADETISLRTLAQTVGQANNLLEVALYGES